MAAVDSDERITAEPHPWDVVIVGTGMGGATLGHSLARQGLRILFLEKGLDAVEIDETLDPETIEDRLPQGRWPGRLTTVVNDRRSDAPMSMGCGLGGSTLLYGAALERFERWDFEATDDMAHPTGGWPVGHDEMARYYAQAEALYRVGGSRDPLGETGSPQLPCLPPPSPTDAQLMRDLERAGLSPYRLHVGITYEEGDPDQPDDAGPRACKSTAKTICIDPARMLGAEVRTECDVVKLEADARRVTGVVYRRDGDLHRVTGRVIVLAAGAYRSPLLLLRSGNAAHPDGLANSSGLVGRNLMFHSVLWLAIFPSIKAALTGPRKTIATRYFQRVGGLRGGLLHSVGLPAGYGNILMFLYDWFDRSRWRRLRPLRPFLRIPARIAETLFGSATILSVNIEDLPYADNRIAAHPDGDADDAIAHYRIRDELKQRTQAVRDAIGAKLSTLRMFWLHGDIMLNFGHPCGTCRFGDDPATSVLDASCRAHDLDNLYVVDASFMPTSAGANPSLTIAANALRVGTLLAARLGAGAAAAKQPLLADPA